MFYKKIYITSLLVSNNIIYNIYLIFNIFLPKYFKDKIINIKEVNDKNYNYLLFLIYSNEILDKYNIDIMKIKDMYDEFINKQSKKNYINNNNVNNIYNNNDNDDNSIKSISSVSSLDSSLSSSLDSSFYDEEFDDLDSNQSSIQE